VSGLSVKGFSQCNH